MVFTRLAVMLLWMGCNAPQPLPAPPMPPAPPPAPFNPGENGFEAALGRLTGQMAGVEVLTLSDQQALVAVTTRGELYSTTTTIVRTDDAGRTWTQTYQASGDWTEWAHVGQTVWWTSHVHTEGRSPSILRSNDGGVSWTFLDLERATGLAQPRHARYRSLTVRSEGQAQVEREDPTSGTRVVWSTVDGGETWQPGEAWDATAPSPDTPLIRVLPRDDQQLVQRRDGRDWWTVGMLQAPASSPQ